MVSLSSFEHFFFVSECYPVHGYYSETLLTYGPFIWYKKTALRLTLNKLQPLACIKISGAIRRTPTIALEALLGR